MTNKYANIQNTQDNIDNDYTWLNHAFEFPERTIRIGTSFSGIGAIEHAFQRLGLNSQIQFAGDIDSDCKKAYMANYKLLEERWHDDIHDFDAKPFKDKVDLFVGGAPCQAFSIRGKRGGFEDTRGTLFSEFARIVIECRPKVFIFENVKGMLNHDNGRTWKTIRKTFEEDCGYQIYYQVLNSKEYGIPQSRDRIFCIGFKTECDFKYPKPIPLTKSMYDFLESCVDTKYFLKQKGAFFVTRTINHIKSYTQVNGDIALCQKRNQQFNWHGDFIYHPIGKSEKIDATDNHVFHTSDFEEQYYLTDNVKKYALTKDCEGGYNMSESNEIIPHLGRYRKLSPRECLNLMGFDDSFKIVVSDAACYKQAGNSIVVNVLMAILRQLDITKYGVSII